MGLFREEVFVTKTDNLHGTINLAIPMSWQLVALCLVTILATAAAFLASASYSRTAIASGSILPRGGILQIVPARAGRVEYMSVREGQSVRKGESLAWIRVEEADRSGTGKQAAILSAIEDQRRGLQTQQDRSGAAATAEQQEYAAQIMGFRQEMQNIGAQVTLERKLVNMAQADLEQATQIAVRGFISRRDLANREETLLSRRQQLASLLQIQAAKASSVEQAERARSQAAANASGTKAALDAARAQVDRDRASTRGDEGYSLVAPADGQVAALNVQTGDAVNAQDPTMAILPSGGHLIARLYIPGKAAGFVHTGQIVRLALDAYPYDRFGTIQGVITVLSSAPLIKADRDGVAKPVYIATAVIQSPFVRVYGQRQTLLPGMTFTARILLEKRSLVQWLFDPLMAATH